MVAAVVALVREAHALFPGRGVVVGVGVATAVGGFGGAFSGLGRPWVGVEVEAWRGGAASGRGGSSAVVFARLIAPSLSPAGPF